jgi:hypothetical protein
LREVLGSKAAAITAKHTVNRVDGLSTFLVTLHALSLIRSSSLIELWMVKPLA